MRIPIEKADLIFGLGSHDTRVAEWGAKLFLEGWAPLLAFSGGLGRLTKNVWSRSEAEIFAEIAKRMGVPSEKIIIEDQASNTGENILFTQKLLQNRNFSVSKVIIVQKPYAERRAFAAFRKLWPEIRVIPSSPPISYDDYPNEEISKDEMLNIMVGDLQRMKVYADRGFQIPQEIPPAVWNAYEGLLELGYNKQLAP